MASLPLTPRAGWGGRCRTIPCILFLAFAGIPSSAELRFTNWSLSSEGAVLSGGGGESLAKYTLWTATNLAAVPEQWTGAETGAFDVAGNFRVTNASSITNPQSYFRLKQTRPDFNLAGFATLDGFSSNATLQVGGTSGGGGGPIVVASNLAWLVNYAQRNNMALKILITEDIDLSPLNNNNPAPGYPTGRIEVGSDKTLYSTNGAAIRRGTLRISGKQNVIIRNLRFRDLWVYDPTGQYDTYGWDYIGVENASHHVWVDHCDFDTVYDGMVDIKSESDFVTVSWNVFRNQKKCNLVGSGDTAYGDRGHLNVTFHHNFYDNVYERTPRMRFGNAHVYNLYFRGGTNIGGKCIQATCEAAVLVENAWFTQATNSYPSVWVNGGPVGNALLVTGSVITNSPGNRGFAQTNAATFSFNAPFVTNRPPYIYELDPASEVPAVVEGWAGVNKLAVSEL